MNEFPAISQEHDAPPGQAAGVAAAPYPAGGDNPPQAPVKMNRNFVFPIHPAWPAGSWPPWRWGKVVPLALALIMVADLAWAEYADVVLNNLSEKGGMRPVIYPHWFHRIRFRCKVCHSELGFKMRVGASGVNMGDIINGKFCGMCHNDQVAWGLEYCHRCHSGVKGLATGIQGGHRSSGPGDY